MELRYDRLGSRLKWVGGVELHYDMLGNRLRWIGDSEVRYDQLGNRPKYIILPDEHSQLTVENLLLVFFVLYEMCRRNKLSDE
jgi:hypothetical protein